MPTITSNNITFMDTSDERKLDVSVEANLPTSQIYDSNTGAYSPDWITNNLVLEACVTLNLIDITQDKNTTITWSKKNSIGEVQSAGSGYRLTISTNELSDGSGIITYICTATYDGITATSQMTFTRVDTGSSVSITNKSIEYAVSNDGQNEPTTGWSTNIPLVGNGQYLWTKTVVTYSDDNSTTSYSVAYNGADGTDGKDGESALSVYINSSNGNIFKGNNIQTTLTCTVYYGITDVTNKVTKFIWKKINQDGTIDESWNRTVSGNVITITDADIWNKASFTCSVEIDL